MTWRPAVREPAPLSTLVHEAIRVHLLPSEPGPSGFAPVVGERWRQATLPNGTVVRADLDVSPAVQRQQGHRACAGILVTGVLSVGLKGYRVEADVLVDLATKAILSCDARTLVAMG